jgi:hypothetical protein
LPLVDVDPDVGLLAAADDNFFAGRKGENRLAESDHQWRCGHRCHSMSPHVVANATPLR